MIGKYPVTYYVDVETGECTTKRPPFKGVVKMIKEEYKPREYNGYKVYDKYVQYRITNKQLNMYGYE